MIRAATISRTGASDLDEERAAISLHRRDLAAA